MEKDGRNERYFNSPVFRSRPGITWDVVMSDIPELKPKIEKIRDELK